MAKPKKVEKVEKVETETKPFGISELSEALNVKPASARVRLRAAGIKKAGRSYGWDQTEFNQVVSELKADVSPDQKSTKTKKLRAVAETVSDTEADEVFFDDSQDEVNTTSEESADEY